MSVGNDVVDLVDPETLREEQHPRFDERVYAPEELALLQRSESEHVTRWLLWAAKEAAYKAEKRDAPDTVFSPRRFVVQPPPLSGEEGAGRGCVRHGERLLTLAAEWTRDFVHIVAMSDAARAGRSVSEVARAARAPSVAARELAATGIGELLGIDPRRLEIDGRPPVVRHDGRDLPVELSLSHHGRFVAFAASLRSSPLRHSE